MSTRETSAEIEAAAADWAVRIDGAPRDETLRRSLDAWLAQDSRRLGAFARAAAVLTHSRRVRALGETFDPDAFAMEPPEPEAKPGPSRRSVLLATSGAAAAAAGGMAVLAFGMQAAAQTYRTHRGEIRIVPLSDGSQVTLNTLSEIRVTYNARHRRVKVISGEALFDVAKDPTRPFEVTAGKANVRAIGTSFTVSRLPAMPVEVMVRHGVVEVKSLADASTSERMGANTRIAFMGDRPGPQQLLPPDEVNRQLAWREGMLSFEDESLASAASEFARYSDIPIRFAQPQIAAETVTGLYAANDPTGFAQAVALSLGLRAEVTTYGVTLSR